MKSNRDHIIASLLYPFWGFIGLLLSGNVRLYYLPALLFFLFFGLTFVIPESGDARSHFEAFTQFSSMTWGEFGKMFKDVILLRSNRYSDLYVLTINFVLSRVTSWGGIYFFVHSLFFGLISLHGLRLFTRDINVRSSYLVHGFFILLVLCASIAKIQYVRYYFAVWMFIVGVYTIFVNRSKRGIPYVLGAVLIHFSFALPLLFLPLFKVTKHRLFMWIFVSLLSLSFSTVFRSYSERIVSVSNTIFGTGGKMSSHTSAYVGNEEYIEQREHRLDDRRWYTQYSNYLMYSYTILLLAIAINALLYNVLPNGHLLVLLNLTLFFFSLTQFGFSFASVGERLQQVFLLICSVFFMQYFANVKKKSMKSVSSIVLLPGVLFVVMSCREMASVGNIIAFLGNPAFMVFNESVSFLGFFGLGD